MEGETDIMLSLGKRRNYLLEMEIQYEIDCGMVDIIDYTIFNLMGPGGVDYPEDFVDKWEFLIRRAVEEAWDKSGYEEEILAYHREAKKFRKGSKK